MRIKKNESIASALDIVKITLDEVEGMILKLK
jgi:hypothetical protein